MYDAHECGGIPMRVILEAFGRLRSEPLDIPEGSVGPDNKLKYMWQLPHSSPPITLRKFDMVRTSTSNFWLCEFECIGGHIVDGIEVQIWSLSSITER